MKDINLTTKATPKPTLKQYKVFAAHAKRICGSCPRLNIAGTLCWHLQQPRSASDEACSDWRVMDEIYFQTTYRQGGRTY